MLRPDAAPASLRVVPSSASLASGATAGGDGSVDDMTPSSIAGASWRAKIAAKLAGGTPRSGVDSPAAGLGQAVEAAPASAPSPLSATAAEAASLVQPVARDTTSGPASWRKAPDSEAIAAPPPPPPATATGTAPPVPLPLSKEEQNRLSAAAMRAELMGDAAKAAELRARVHAAQAAEGSLSRYPLLPLDASAQGHGAAGGWAGGGGGGGVHVISHLDARGVPIPSLASSAAATLGA